MKNLLEGLSVALNEADEALLIERLTNEKAKWIEGAKNDPKFIDELKSKEAGKFYGELERKIHKIYGISPDDIEGDLKGMKLQEAMLKHAKAKLEEGKDQTNQELQQKFLEANAEIKRLNEDVIPSKLESERETFYSQFVDDQIFKDASEFETVCTPDTRVSIIKSYMDREGLKTKWNPEKKTYETLRKADNLLYTVDDKPVSNLDISKMALEKSGVLVLSNGGGGDGANAGGSSGSPAPKAGELSDNAKQMAASFQVK